MSTTMEAGKASEPVGTKPGLSNVGKLKVFAVLPNLSIERPFETNYVGILPPKDPRLKQIASRNQSVCARHCV